MQSYPNAIGGGQATAVATPSAQRQLAFHQTFDRFDRVVAVQETLIQKLGSRLSPAMKQVSCPLSETGKPAEKSSDCELVQLMDKYIRTIHMNNTTIEFFLDNLEF